MKISEIYNVLNSIAPFELQESWDNSGLIVGSMSDEFNSITLSLDLDSSLVARATPGTLFITHHPLIFKGLKRLDGSKYPANLIKAMIKKDISLIAMHTNYDKVVLNKFVLSEILGYKNYEEVGEFVLKFEVNKSFEEFANQIKSRLNLSTLRVVKSSEFIKTAALCTGSGSELIGSFEVDCFLSGDFKYHTALEAYENSLSLIDINHFESEQYFGESLALNLQKFGLFATITNSINPFEYR